LPYNQGMTVSGEISNFGTQAVTSMTLNYSIDNGTPVTQSLQWFKYSINKWNLYF
jgi:hypothetical protein